MKRLIEHLDKRAEEIKTHPFLLFMDTLSAEEAYRLTSEAAIPFIHLGMTFRDINNLYLAYENPNNVYEEIINGHACADNKHWRLLLKDLQSLGLDNNALMTDIIKVLWDEKNTYFRKYIYSVLARAKSAGKNPFLRFVAMESAERTVRVFFDSLRRISTLVNELKDIELVYFGHEHIDTELETQIDTTPFEAYEANEEELETYISLCNEHIDSFIEFLDGKMAVYATSIKQKPAKDL